MSYHGLPPRQRGAYLTWLEKASVARAAGPLEFHILYFLGLERRSLVDGLPDEEEELYEEIQRFGAQVPEGPLHVAIESLLRVYEARAYRGGRSLGQGHGNARVADMDLRVAIGSSRGRALDVALAPDIGTPC